MARDGIPLDHIGLFYDGSVGPAPVKSLLAGLAPSERAMIFATERRLATIALPEAHAGVVVHPAVDADAALDRVISGIRALASRGVARVRLLGFPDWGDRSWPPPEDHLWLESRWSVVTAALPTTVVCVWDVARLPAQAAFYLEELHRLVWRDGLLAENPHAIEPGRWTIERGARLPWLAPRRRRTPRI